MELDVERPPDLSSQVSSGTDPVIFLMTAGKIDSVSCSGEGPMPVRLPIAMRAPVEFAIHVMVGGILFLVVALVTVLIAAAVKGLESLNVAFPWLIQGLEAAEKVVFWVDMGVFGLLLLAEILRLGRGVLQDWS